MKTLLDIIKPSLYLVLGICAFYQIVTLLHAMFTLTPEGIYWLTCIGLLIVGYITGLFIINKLLRRSRRLRQLRYSRQQRDIANTRLKQIYSDILQRIYCSPVPVEVPIAFPTGLFSDWKKRTDLLLPLDNAYKEERRSLESLFLSYLAYGYVFRIVLPEVPATPFVISLFAPAYEKFNRARIIALRSGFHKLFLSAICDGEHPDDPEDMKRAFFRYRQDRHFPIFYGDYYKNKITSPQVFYSRIVNTGYALTLQPINPSSN